MLLMMVVPPSKAFEGHLEWWCRDPKFRDLKSKYNCKGLLRRRIYLGVDEHVPTEEELEIMVADFEGKEAAIFNDFIGPRLRLGDFEQPDRESTHPGRRREHCVSLRPVFGMVRRRVHQR